MTTQTVQIIATEVTQKDLPEVSINEEQKVYVIAHGDHLTTNGFQYIFDQVARLARKVGAAAPTLEYLGTMALYKYYRDLIRHAQVNRIDLGTWYSDATPEALCRVLDEIIKARLTVRVWYGNTDPEQPGFGRPWLEEHDMYGKIGRSSGTLKIPLIVPPGEDGGGGLLDKFVLRIKSNAGVELYRHPNFWERDFEIRPCDVEGLKAAVHVDGSSTPHARFKNKEAAARWVGFMKGERMRP